MANAATEGNQRSRLIGDGTFEILRIMLDASDDEDVFEPPGDVQLAVTHEAEVSGAQKRTLGVRCVRAESAVALFRPIPISPCHARAGDPDLAGLIRGTRMPVRRIGNEQPRAERGPAARDGTFTTALTRQVRATDASDRS